MGITFEDLKKLLGNFDASEEPLEPHHIWSALHNLDLDTEPGKDELKAEKLAFWFIEYSPTYQEWDTYYGPLAIATTEDGQKIQTPDIKWITPEILDYWKNRSSECQNPVLVNRYADLVWDFSLQIISRKDSSIALRVIDSAIQIAEQGRYKHATTAIKIIQRALDITLNIREVERLGKLLNVIIALEDKISKDASPGTWGLTGASF